MKAGQTDEGFVTWFVDEFLPEHFPEAFNGVSRRALYKMHTNGLKYARHFGFEQREDQGQFLALMNDVGPDFWRFDGFKQAIVRSDLTPKQRISLIYETVTDDQFSDALFGQDPLYWFPHQISPHPLGIE